MGQAIVLIVSMCWIALAMTIAGTLLVRFAVTRKTGVVFRARKGTAIAPAPMEATP